MVLATITALCHSFVRMKFLNGNLLLLLQCDSSIIWSNRMKESHSPPLFYSDYHRMTTKSSNTAKISPVLSSFLKLFLFLSEESSWSLIKYCLSSSSNMRSNLTYFLFDDTGVKFTKASTCAYINVCIFEQLNTIPFWLLSYLQMTRLP